MAVRFLALAIAAYALSPIDLIPDFIPILGYLDDLIIVPLGILLVLKFTPRYVIEENRAMAATMAQQPSSNIAAAAIIGLWIATTLVVGYWILSKVHT